MEPSHRRYDDPRVSREGYPVNDVTAFADQLDLEAFEVLRWAPVWMTRAERLLVFSMAFCLRPKRYLEIGTLHGGSALLVCAAMDAIDSDGQIICIDPQPLVDPDHWAKIEHRSIMIEDFSPACLPEATERAGGKFDMVLIDGEHTRDAVIRDVAGVLPFLEDGAYLLFHDSFYDEVRSGIEDSLETYAAELVDFGTMTREVTADPSQTHWGGIRMAQVRRPQGEPLPAASAEPAALPTEADEPLLVRWAGVAHKQGALAAAKSKEFISARKAR